MNRISPKEYIYISITILFLVLSFIQIKDFIIFKKENTAALTKEWNKGIKTLYGIVKKTVIIKDFNPKQISLKTFESSPIILKFKPDSNIELSDITIFPENDRLLIKNSISENIILNNIKIFTITPIDKNGNETEDIARTTGFKFFFILNSREKEIPVEFSVFSEYLFQKIKYPNFFDFIDNREFF